MKKLLDMIKIALLGGLAIIVLFVLFVMFNMTGASEKMDMIKENVGQLETNTTNT